MIFLSPGDQDPFGPIFIEWNLPIECFSFSEDQIDFYRVCGCSASILLHIIQLCQHSIRDVPHSIDIYRICAWPAVSIALYTKSGFPLVKSSLCASFIKFTAVSYRSVHVIRVSTRQILALRELCAYCVFDPRFVSCWPMFADLSVVRRRSARCLLKLCSRLRQTQYRIHKIDTSRTICYILLFEKKCVPAYAKRYFE